MLDQVGAGIASEDARALERAAHSFKGSVAMFGAAGAGEAASKLEIIGKTGDLRLAHEVFAVLNREVALLAAELNDFCRGEKHA
jgi:HPt (histidine-containing phosphotransfer) domain-containing protein